MKRYFVFAVAAALATAMGTMAWSESGVAGGSSVGASSFTRANPFNNSRIRRQLDLSQNQIRQLRDINNSWRQQLQRLRRGADNDVNQMWQQYVTTLSNVLTEQQQQLWSQLIGPGNTFGTNTIAGRTGTTTSRNFGTGNFPTGTHQGNGGGGSGALGTAFVTGEPAQVSGQQEETNRAGPTQAQGGGGSSAFGTALVTGEPPQVPGRRPQHPNAGPTQAQGGGGSSAFGTALLTGLPPEVKGIRLTGPGRTQAQGGGGSSLFGTLQLTGGTAP